MDLIDKIAADLTDEEHIAWARGDIARWIDEGIGLAISIDPRLFSVKKVVELEPCVEHQPVPCCDFIFNVVGQSDENGKVFRRLRRASSWGNPWTVGGCSSPQWKGLTRYMLEGRKELYVAPEPPSHVPTYIVVECSSKDDVDYNNLPSGVEAAMIMWVLYRARNKDAESSVAADLGEANYQKMKELLLLAGTEGAKEKLNDK